MTDKVKVSAIQIQYPDGESKQLTLEEARELYNQLEGLFGDKTTYVPSAPIIIERDRYPLVPRWTDHTLRSDSPLTNLPQIWCCTEE